ncbi:RING finger protein 121-like [Xenia sp. Carnegie-2017]|uniref:RING finger protein 121-like n=1 Tax=Xenia sp. Carnegie-2017 TaxID=2897299 RepID=UPI001F0343A7|nr:RING finger protein 121-like [Xenia sp. Carnegie-2017]
MAASTSHDKQYLNMEGTSYVTKTLSFQEQQRLEHEKLHEKHKGHEAMHLEMILILLTTLAVAQILLVQWKKRHFKSYQMVTLFGVWVIPLYFNIRLRWFRMLFFWSIFSISTAYIVYNATRQPLAPTTPRMVYKWFFFIHKGTTALSLLGYFAIMLTLLGVSTMLQINPDIAAEFGLVVLFYGLYFGVLGRDFAEICADKMASKLGYTTVSGLPSRKLNEGICAVCGQKIEPENTSEKTCRLSCGHIFHEFCIRGWCIVGKKQTCPYCKEKVDLKRMFPNPWEKPHILFGQLLDWLRYLIVWQPVIILVVQLIVWILGLE